MSINNEGGERWAVRLVSKLYTRDVCSLRMIIYLISTESGGTLSSESESSARVNSANIQLQSKQLERLLNACSVQIHDLLHMETVFPYLVQEDLLTQREKDKLCSLSSALPSDEAKITYLMNVLPKKGRNALPRFLKCLECTAGGTAHIELAHIITRKVNEFRGGDNDAPKGIKAIST